MMRNLFVKNYVAFALLIMFSLTVASMSFLSRVSAFDALEKQEQLTRTVNYVSDMLSKNIEQVSGENAEQSFMPIYLEQLVDSNGFTIMFTDT